MRGYPDLNRAVFNKAADKLRLEGHEVFNPPSANLEWMNLRQLFEYELGLICNWAEGIAMLPGWSMSVGANAEHAAAKAVELVTRYLTEADLV